jgi:hypothetical protein
MEYDSISNDELYLLLKERYPAAAEAVEEVSDSNRETVIAFIKFLSEETG